MTNNSEPLLIDPVLLEQAERLCKQRLEADPENSTALRSLGEVSRKQGHLEEARAAYERLQQFNPQDNEAGYMQAVLGGKEWPTAPRGTHAAPFVLIKEFLPQEFRDSLVSFMTAARDKFLPVMASRNDEYDPDIRQTLGFPGEWEGRKRFSAHLAEILPRVVSRLHVPQFDVHWGEVQVRAYPDGHFFKIHRDAGPRSLYASRMINYVYYFHKVPRAFTGGELLLFDTDIETFDFTTSRFTRVVPEDNSIIFFPPTFYHSVVPVRCPSKEFSDSRFTINGHVHKRVEAKPAVDGSVESHRGVAVS